MMVVHPSGYYAWKANPISARQKEDQRLSGLIKQFWRKRSIDDVIDADD